VLGLRLCLQPLLRLSSRRRCCGGHLVLSFTFWIVDACRSRTRVGARRCALKPTPLPWRAFAELMPWWSCRKGHRDDRGVWRAILRGRLDRILARPRAAQGRRPTMPRVLVARDSGANRRTSFIADQTTADGDTRVVSSITLPCATSS
jgi:hypothetical protein